MKLTLKLLSESVSSLSTLAAVKGPAKFCFKVAKAVKKFREELDALEVQRKAVVAKYGAVEDPKTHQYLYPNEEDRNAAAAEFGELLKEEVDFAIEKIDVPVDLNGLSANDLMALEWLVSVKD